MATLLSNPFMEIRRACLRADDARLSDGQLLGRFVRERDLAALEALVRRHGPMVWSVCRRVLGSHHDAEDAFQATFLVLVRKAASVRPPELVGNWLYGVARQTALKARATGAKRRLRELALTGAEREPAPPNSSSELGPLLDEELSRLPHKYRAALVVCDLEGKTRGEAARQLGVAEGTVASRLARARALLAKRLTRQGIAVSAAALQAALAEQTAAGGAPLAVAADTLRAIRDAAIGNAVAEAAGPGAAALAEGVLHTMWLGKCKAAALVAVLSLAIACGVWTAYRQHSATLPVARKQATDAAAKTKGQAALAANAAFVKLPQTQADTKADKKENKNDSLPQLPPPEKLLKGPFASVVKLPHTSSQGFRFRYPYDGGGAMMTFRVDRPEAHYRWRPKVDASTAAGRKAIFETMRDADKGPHFTMDGKQLVVFNGARIVPLELEDERVRKSWVDAFRRIPLPLFVEYVKRRHAAARPVAGPVEKSYVLSLGNAPVDERRFFAALTSDDQLVVLVITRRSEDFWYDVGHFLHEPLP